VVLLSGDVPLLRPETLQRLVRTHLTRGAAATVLTARVSGPHEYGRIVRHDGRIAAIVEHKDATPEQRAIDEINSGIYAFALEPLFAALKSIGSANAQAEYYLPDLVAIYRAQGREVETVLLEDAREILGVRGARRRSRCTTAFGGRADLARERVRRYQQVARGIADLHVAERGGGCGGIAARAHREADNSSSGSPVVKVCVDEAT